MNEATTAEKNNIRKWRYFVPNAITLLSVVFAIVSITLSFQGFHIAAAWFILYCTLLDKLDGLFARLLGSYSQFGMELDSFADFAAFGLAPAALVWNTMVHPSVAPWESPVAAVCIFYSLLSVIRLVHFNVSQDKLPKNYFVGLPITISGGFIASIYLSLNYHHWFQPANNQRIQIIIMAVLAILMVSNAKMAKLGTSKRSWLNALGFICVALAFAFILINKFPLYLVIVGAGYVLFGLVVIQIYPEDY